MGFSEWFVKQSSTDTIFGENTDTVRVNLYVTPRPPPVILFKSSRLICDVDMGLMIWKNKRGISASVYWVVRCFIVRFHESQFHDTCIWWSGDHFKNVCKCWNFLLLNRIHIFQCMGKIFCGEFQSEPLKFHTKYLSRTSKDMIFIKH